MARTIRRKTYVPVWVVRKLKDTEPGASGFCGHRWLEGAELAKELRWWHEDKGSSWWTQEPKKSFRKQQRAIERMATQRELSKYRKNAEYEVMVLPDIPYPYWD